MKKILLGIVIGVLFFVAIKQVEAISLQPVTLSTPGTTRTLNLPPAADNSPVIPLGTALDPGTGEVVEGYAIVHYKDRAAKPAGERKATNTCSTYLASGAKWKSLEPWVVNPANGEGLDGGTVFNLLAGGIGKWEEATDGNVKNGAGYDILGEGAVTGLELVADTSAPDDQNEVYFADITDSSAIAVTIVWGIFGGPPQTRKLVEWDQVYDDVTFNWSAEATGVSEKMDFDNIATHELGHGVGMGDLYNTCTEETMYGYAIEGETKKRDLNAGDIAGINKLY